MKEFADKVAVITGGGSGIGLGMARAFAKRGMKLVLADLDKKALDEAVKEFQDGGTQVVGQYCDVSKLEEIQALADYTMDAFGAVHVLCNNAGIGIPTSSMKIKLKDWKWIIDVDLWGPIYGVQVFLPLIEAQGEGHINSTSSMAGLMAGRTMGAYNVAKHGVVALMASLERELRSRKSPITTSVLCPGPINTNISRHSVEFRPAPDHVVDQIRPKKHKPGSKGDKIQAILEQGMQPDEVGTMVADAIESGKFWVLTHPWWIKGIQKELDAMRDDQSLTKG